MIELDKPIFSVRLAELRNNRGLTQQQIADETDLTRARLNNYEQGIREPDLTTLTKLAQFFNVSVDYLLGNVFYDRSPDLYPYKGEITKDHSDPEVVKLLTEEGIKKLILIKDMSLEELKEFVEFARRIKNKNG